MFFLNADDSFLCIFTATWKDFLWLFSSQMQKDISSQSTITNMMIEILRMFTASLNDILTLNSPSRNHKQSSQQSRSI